MSKIGKKIKVIWYDAVSITPKRKGGALLLGEKIIPTVVETTGILIKELNEGLIIKDPISIKVTSKEPYPEKNPTFYFIPKGMIETIEEIT